MKTWELVTIFNTFCFWVPIIFRSWWAWKVKRASRDNGSNKGDLNDRLDIERNLRKIVSTETGFYSKRTETNQDRGK